MGLVGGKSGVVTGAEPSEVAEAVVWLASDRASIVTGAGYANDLGTSAGFAR